MDTNNKGHAANVAPYDLNKHSINCTESLDDHPFAPGVPESAFANGSLLSAEQTGATFDVKADLRAAPEPLRASLRPADPYPVEQLGDILGGAAQILHDVVKAPLAMCCQSVLAAASLAAQAHYDVQLPWGGRKPLSLFLLTVGESGERKSAIDDLVLGAAKNREKAEMSVYQADLQKHEAELAAWTKAAELARNAARGRKKSAVTASEIRSAVESVGPKPTAPIAPVRFITDPTVEGLFKLLAISQPSVALFSDEGGLLIGGHALNSDNALKTMARWCKMWDGSPFDRVRSGDGAGILYGRRMAMHQLAQPEVMTRLLSDRMANGQGLLARCLVAWPESTIGTRFVDSYEWAGDRPELKRLFAKLSELMEAEPHTALSTTQELEPFELRLSAEATELSVKANNEFERHMAADGDLAEISDRASKAVENACRIAGVLAAIESGLSARRIEVSHLSRALVIVQWYLAEALRLRSASVIPATVLDGERLLSWLQERGIREFRTQPILHSGPNSLRDREKLKAAIKELVDSGYLFENKSNTLVDGVMARKSWKVLHYVV